MYQPKGKIYKASLGERRHRAHLLLWFVVVLITKPEIHGSPATFTKFAESLNSSISWYNLLHFSLEQKRGASSIKSSALMTVPGREGPGFAFEQISNATTSRTPLISS